MTREVLETAIHGINREIKNRQSCLALRREWVLNPLISCNQYTWEGFYYGQVLVNQIQKLKIIKLELSLILARMGFAHN